MLALMKPVAALLEGATAVVAAAESTAVFATTAVAFACYAVDASTVEFASSAALVAVSDADFEAYVNLIEEG